MTVSRCGPAVRAAVPERLTGERVLLKPLTLPDVQSIWDAIEESRSRLAPWLPWAGRSHSMADERAWIRAMARAWRRRVSLAVGIFERRTGRFLGGTGFNRIDWTLRGFEIGYWIRTSAEGRGYVSEAVCVLTRFAFDRLRAVRVEIRMHPRNARSRAVPQRLGFVLEGTLRRCITGAGGRPEDRHVFALTRDDYERVACRTRRPRRAGRRAET